MIRYDQSGGNDYYLDQTVTTTGNKLTNMLRFTCSSRAGTAFRNLLTVHATTLATRR